MQLFSERQKLAKANRTMDKKVKESLMQLEEERRQASQYKDQVSDPCLGWLVNGERRQVGQYNDKLSGHVSII